MSKAYIYKYRWVWIVQLMGWKVTIHGTWGEAKRYAYSIMYPHMDGL